MINAIHSLATSAANTVAAALQIPGQLGRHLQEPDALAADLPPAVQQALARIEDPDERHRMTLVVRGDLVPAGVPNTIQGPDLARGTAGVTDYLSRLLEAMRVTREDPDAEDIWPDDVTENLDESIRQIEDLLRRIDPSHPALLEANSAAPGKLDLVA